MANVILVALSGYNVLTDTNPDHFALYADQSVDYILIKENARGNVNIPVASSSYNIAHGLSYVPFCLAFVEVTAGVWKKLYSTAIDGTAYSFEINDTNLILHAAGKQVAYFIFYDNIT